MSSNWATIRVKARRGRQAVLLLGIRHQVVNVKNTQLKGSNH